MHVPHALRTATGMLLVSAAMACDDADRLIEPISSPTTSSSATDGQFRFTPLPASAACGPSTEQPFVLPAGYAQTVFAREGDGGTVDLWDMATQNETGPETGRFLYRTHEIGSNGQVSVTDLETNPNVTRVLAQRADWERLDGIAWTPWKTILVAEETTNSTLKDPTLPTARAGHVYEINPETGAAVLRAAVGSRSHEGLRFDSQGNLYGISESSPPTGGYIFKFVPDHRGDLSSGQLYALKVVAPTGDRTGEARWLPLNTAAVVLDSDAEATRVGATGYGRPEDVEIFTSTGNGGGQVLYVAITSEHRVLGIDLREPRGGRDHATALVYDYVRAGVNAPADFTSPDNLALDKAGNLYITEDPSTPPGADIWVATPGKGGQHHRPGAPFALPACPTALQSRAASTSTSGAGASLSTFSTVVDPTHATWR
jgi:hypothetical protein